MIKKCVGGRGSLQRFPRLPSWSKGEGRGRERTRRGEMGREGKGIGERG